MGHVSRGGTGQLVKRESASPTAKHESECSLTSNKLDGVEKGGILLSQERTRTCR